MSENLTRKNSLRRNIAAVIGAVSLACGSVAVPVVAPEYAPVSGAQEASTSQNWDSVDGPSFEPQVVISVDDENPKDTFNYILTFDAQPPRPVTRPGEGGESNLYDFEVWINAEGGGTELVRTPQPSDFTWASGVERPFSVETLEDGRVVAFFGEIPNGDYLVKATIPARVAENALKPFAAEAGVFARLRPKVGWEKEFTRLDRDPADDLFFYNSPAECRAENFSKYVLRGGGYGQQLVQLFIGADKQNLSLGDESLPVNRAEELAQQGWWIQPGFAIRVTDPFGNKITEEVMQKARSIDPKTTPLDPFQGTATPNFLQAWQWNFNASTNDDSDQIDPTEVWLRSGTTIELHQSEHIDRAPDGSCSLGESEFDNDVLALSHFVSYRKAPENGWRSSIHFGAASAAVGDRVWIDANRNGVQDEGEENLAGVNVTVTPPAGSDEQARTATTDADGKWRIDELTPGVEYTVSFELPDGYKATDALVGEDRGVDSNGLRSTVTLKPGEYNETYDLGVFQPASVGDFVWEDTNGNGIQDDGEPAVPNTIVRVTGPNGETHTTATDKDGKWSVDGLTPGVEYTVKFTVPEGYSVTKTEQGEDRGKDSNPLSSAVSLKPGENNTTYDLGLIKPASVGDRVWVDENADGIQDENEKNGVPNAKVTVTAPEGVDEQPRTTTTDDKGNWRIDGLTPGVEYTVTFELPEGVSATKSLVGDDRGVDSNELSTKITLESGQHDPTIDLGVVPASIGDRVWLDEGGEEDEEKVGRADGIQNDGEGGIADVVVRVSRPGEEVRETKTGAGGTWKIEGLTPGVDDYRVEFDAPDGYRVSPTKAGDAAVDSNGLSDKVAALKSGEFNDTYDLGLFIEVPETTTVTTSVTTVKTTTVPTPCDCSPTTVPTTVTSKVPVPTTTTQVVSTTKTQSVPTTVTSEVSVPTTVPTTVTSRVPVPTTVPTTTTQAVPTTLTTEVPVPTTVPTTLTTEVPVPTTVPTTVTSEVSVPTTVPTTTTQAVPTTLTTEVPVPTTVPTTVTSEVSVPTTTTQAVPTTVEKPVPVPTTVHSTTTAEAPKRGTIGDKVWEDTNGDGKEDPDEKTGIPNVPVVIVDKDGNEVTRTVTDKDGNWKVDVEPGEYTVRYEPGDRTPSDPEQVKRTVTIKPGEKRDDIDLGVLPSGSVGDRVWNDEDGDGEQGEDEKGVPNVIVEVSREGEPTRTTHTDENGGWKIEGLNPDAEYEVRFIKPEGWEVTGKVPGSDESGLVSKVTVKPNEYNDSYDLGLQKVDPGCDCEPVKPGTIGNRVWIDLNGNGKQDPNETEGVPDVTVIVRDADGNEVTRTVTDEDGNWKVNVEPGDYEIEYRPRDWKPTDPKRVTQKVTVEEGKEYLDLDLGVQKPKPGEPTPPTDEPAPDPEKGSSTETLDRCVANAVRSPLLYLVPVALLGAFGGEIARPYMGAINEQVNQINAQFQEAMRRNSPDWGHGGRGGRDNDQFAELRGQIDAANRRIAELGQDPNVQRFGTVAAGIIGLIAAGGVLYDWCSNEKGEAFTSIGGSSSKDAA